MDQAQRRVAIWLSGLLSQVCILFLCEVIAAAGLSAAETDTSPAAVDRLVPTVAELAGLPVISQPKLSPNGEWLAWFGSAGNQRILVVKRVLDNKTEPFVARNEKWTLRQVIWLSDNRLLASVSIPQMRAGLPLVVTRLMLIDPATNKVRQMFERDTKPGNFQIQDRVVSTLRDNTDEILVQMNPSDGSKPAVRYATLKNGRLSRRHAQKSKKGIYTWNADEAGVVRMGTGVASDQKSALLQLKDSTGEWQQFPKLANDGSFSVVGLPVDRPGVVYAVSDHEFALGALYEFEVDSRSFGKMIAQNDDSEISSISMDADGKSIEAIYFSNEFVPTRYLDPVLASLKRALDKQLPDTTNTLVSASDDHDWILVRAFASDVDPHFILYDRARNRADVVGSAYLDLQNRRLAKTTLASYKARDGLTIPAYVTLPVDVDQAEGASVTPAIPFVVLPHGGPHARDFLRFDWLVQLLASQGYGVLQINFRGSTGYGREFLEAGKGNWGKAMQDDITDGTRWLVAQGLADPQKLCIAGGSYGGYAALMGVVKEPELYQAAISFNGVSDLPDLLRLENRFLAGRYRTRFIGNLWRDRKSLAHNSPARRASEIKVPLLLVHGEDDRVVSARQTRKMYKAMRSGKTPVSYIELKDGDHFLSRGANRIKFSEETVKFLAAHCQ